jgi:hypothetical protein
MFRNEGKRTGKGLLAALAVGVALAAGTSGIAYAQHGGGGGGGGGHAMGDGFHGGGQMAGGWHGDGGAWHGGGWHGGGYRPGLHGGYGWYVPSIDSGYCTPYYYNNYPNIYDEYCE